MSTLILYFFLLTRIITGSGIKSTSNHTDTSCNSHFPAALFEQNSLQEEAESNPLRGQSETVRDVKSHSQLDLILIAIRDATYSKAVKGSYLSPIIGRDRHELLIETNREPLPRILGCIPAPTDTAVMLLRM